MDLFVTFFSIGIIAQALLAWRSSRTIRVLTSLHRQAHVAASIVGARLYAGASDEFLHITVRSGVTKLVHLESNHPFLVFLYKEMGQEEDLNIDDITLLAFCGTFKPEYQEEIWKTVRPIIVSDGTYHIWLGRHRDQPKVRMTVVAVSDDDTSGDRPTLFQTT